MIAQEDMATTIAEARTALAQAERPASAELLVMAQRLLAVSEKAKLARKNAISESREWERIAAGATDAPGLHKVFMERAMRAAQRAEELYASMQAGLDLAQQCAAAVTSSQDAA